MQRQLNKWDPERLQKASAEVAVSSNSNQLY